MMMSLLLHFCEIDDIIREECERTDKNSKREATEL
jgi:hypothetical protein